MLTKERDERKKRKDSLTMDIPEENVGGGADKPAADVPKGQIVKPGGDQGNNPVSMEQVSGAAEMEEFSKTMMTLFDDNELKERKRDQMYGNMYLITELYIAKQLNGNIIKTCLDDLQQEINDQNIEIMCYMVDKLMTDLCKGVKTEWKLAATQQ